MSSRIDLGISVAGHGSNNNDRKYIHITRGDVVDRIKNHPSIDPWTKEYLYRRVNDYPDSALGFFVENINQIVVGAINERSRTMTEQHNENKRKIEDSACEVNQFGEFQQPSSGVGGIGIGETGDEEAGVEIEVSKTASQEIEEGRESLFTRPLG